MDGWKRSHPKGGTKEKEEQEKGEDQGSCRRSQRGPEQEGAEEEESGANTHKPDTLEQLLEKWTDAKENDPWETKKEKKNR